MSVVVFEFHIKLFTSNRGLILEKYVMYLKKVHYSTVQSFVSQTEEMKNKNSQQVKYWSHLTAAVVFEFRPSISLNMLEELHCYSVNMGYTTQVTAQS